MDVNARRRFSSLKAFMGADIAFIISLFMAVVSITLFGTYLKQREELEIKVELKIHEHDLEALAKQAEKAGSWKELEIQLAKSRELLTEIKRLFKDNELTADQAIKRLQDLKLEIDNLRKVTDTPPILTLAETQGFSFTSGSAEVPIGFRNRLIDEIIPNIIDTMEKIGANTILVEGHTDMVPFLSKKQSNLDTLLLDFLTETYFEGELVSTSNTELAMARAAAVARILMQDPILNRYHIRPISAGQTVSLNGSLNYNDSSSNASLRRIEIRLTRSRR